MSISSNDSSQNASLFLPPSWKPHGYQQRGVEWLITHPEGALFFAPGLGKTSTTLAAILKLKELGYPARALVFAPLRVAQTTWMNEHKRWLQFMGLRVGLAHGPDKLEILQNPRYDIVVINYDAIQWLASVLPQKHGFLICVFDELTKVKHTNTKRFKALKPLLPTFSFRWGLTGSPAANGLLDLFGQLYVLDLGYRLGKYITHYRLKYFHQKPRDEFNWYITSECAEQIHKKVADLAMYIQPEEVLKLPDITHVELPVTLPKKAWDQYKSLEVLAIMELKEQMITASNAGVLTNKLRQVASGAIYTSVDKDWEEVHSTKLEVLDDLLEELAGEPLLLAYNFSHEVERIQKAHPHALVIRGGMSDTAVVSILDRWNSGLVPLLCVQCDAAAHGLNLQVGGCRLCWFSQTYNLEVYLQLTARLHRQGQANAVIVYHILAEKTVDYQIRKVLQTKGITQTELFATLKDLMLS